MRLEEGGGGGINDGSKLNIKILRFSTTSVLGADPWWEPPGGLPPFHDQLVLLLDIIYTKKYSNMKFNIQ